MKQILLLTVLFSQACFPQEAYLKGGVITVALKNGQSYKFSSDEYMVVKRHGPAAAPVDIAADDEVGTDEAVLIMLGEAAAEQPYRFTLHGGIGPNYEIYRKSQYQVIVREKKEFVFGASLSRKVSKDASVTGTALSNDTYLLGLGMDFK